VPSQQLQGQLQTQHSVDTSNYIMDKNGIKWKIYVLEADRKRFVLISFCMLQQLIHSVTVTCFAKKFTMRFERKDLGNRQGNSSYCIECLSILGNFNEGDNDNSGLGNNEKPFVQPWLSSQWFPFVCTNNDTHIRQKFRNYDELRSGVLNCLWSQDNNFCGAGISNMPRPRIKIHMLM
jgi:hypothetical protein